ncbi:DUF2800 domain-containing protein [Paramagnetospirillum magneticum]|uniref:DUF2800 domain-containing protein n=1 Tax=Paramagnetospirillum magneticum (strain ATCC 700264 / AMB-1) TaxID=342108 RepID=Q2W3Q1_PARM1|nr:DUF2800 domain-containing protein [Paramagnetospirillum magneticum]BAE51524.1 hypothetical protein amb2720 [Paramagnetospirillum magneticum AMB-1]
MNAPLVPIDKSGHVEHGFSSYSRYAACPGSIRECRKAPPERPSPYAEEGTDAHECGEIGLRQGIDAIELIDRKVGGSIVDEDMAAAVQVYLDFCRSQIEDGDIVFVELPVDLAPLNPPVPLRSRLDFARYRPSTQSLLVTDYKHGQLVVEVHGNGQLRGYALGACVELDKLGHVVSEVQIAIVQPRAYHEDGPIRFEVISAFELFEWSVDLFDVINRTLEPDAPLVAGEHCRFCRAKPVCPEMERMALATAEAQFTDTTITVPPAPSSMAPARIGQVLNAAEIIEGWLKSVREHAHASLEQGVEIPGWKLVPKRAQRKWADDDLASDALLTAGLPILDIYTRKIITPAAADKLLGKNKDVVKHLVVAESSGTTLAPAGDKRQAVAGGAAADFTSLE